MPRIASPDRRYSLGLFLNDTALNSGVFSLSAAAAGCAAAGEPDSRDLRPAGIARAALQPRVHLSSPAARTRRTVRPVLLRGQLGGARPPSQTISEDASAVVRRQYSARRRTRILIAQGGCSASGRRTGLADCFGRGIRDIDTRPQDWRITASRWRWRIFQQDYYFTEKLIDCFLMETVPVYWGCPGIGSIFDERGILRFETPDELMRSLAHGTEFRAIPGDAPVCLEEQTDGARQRLDRITRVCTRNWLDSWPAGSTFTAGCVR
jgi:hypothetical protein